MRGEDSDRPAAQEVGRVARDRRIFYARSAAAAVGCISLPASPDRHRVFDGSERGKAAMSPDEASGPVKAAHKAAILEVQQRNEAAHKAAKEKRKAADIKAEIRRRAEERK
jgi:hypothetical protein